MIRVRVNPLRLYTDPSRIVQKRVERAGALFLPRCEPYIPKKTGALIRSGSFTMEGKVGRIRWAMPYARMQSYRRRNRDGKRGNKWAIRAWAAHRREIAQQVNRGH